MEAEIPVAVPATAASDSRSQLERTFSIPDMATLRSVLSRLAPDARLLGKGVRGSSGPSVTARRTIYGSGFKSPVFWDEHFNLKSPATWFGIFSIAVAGTYRIKVGMIDHEKRIRAKEEEEKANRLKNPIT